MKKPKNRVRGMQLSEISIVDRGANQGAKSVLFKRKEVCLTKAGEREMNLEEIVKKVTDLEKSVTSQTSTIESLTKNLEEITKERDELLKAKADSGKDPKTTKKPKVNADGETPEEEMKEMMAKAMTEEIQKKMDTLEKSVNVLHSQLEKSNEKLEIASLEKRVVTEFADVIGTTEQKAKFLKMIEKSEDEELKKYGLQLLKSSNEALTSKFQEIGKGGIPTGDSEARITELAKAHAKEKNIEFSKAYSAILETPEGAKLYEQSEREKGRAR